MVKIACMQFYFRLNEVCTNVSVVKIAVGNKLLLLLSLLNVA